MASFNAQTSASSTGSGSSNAFEFVHEMPNQSRRGSQISSKGRGKKRQRQRQSSVVVESTKESTPQSTTKRAKTTRQPQADTSGSMSTIETTELPDDRFDHQLPNTGGEREDGSENGSMAAPQKKVKKKAKSKGKEKDPGKVDMSDPVRKLAVFQIACDYEQAYMKSKSNRKFNNAVATKLQKTFKTQKKYTALRDFFKREIGKREAALQQRSTGTGTEPSQQDSDYDQVVDRWIAITKAKKDKEQKKETRLKALAKEDSRSSKDLRKMYRIQSEKTSDESGESETSDSSNSSASQWSDEDLIEDGSEAEELVDVEDTELSTILHEESKKASKALTNNRRASSSRSKTGTPVGTSFEEVAVEFMKSRMAESKRSDKVNETIRELQRDQAELRSNQLELQSNQLELQSNQVEMKADVKAILSLLQQVQARG